MLILLLSGVFCCLCVSGVNFFFAVWAGACFIFCCLGGGTGPAQTAKKTLPRPNSTKINAPSSLPSVFCFAVWAGRRFCFFCCLCGVRVFCFAIWAGDVFFFFLGCCLGGVRILFAARAGSIFFFAVCARVVFSFVLFGRGACFFCCLGGGREFTHLPVCLARLHSTQQQKKDQTAKKKNTGSGYRPRAHAKAVQAHQHGAVDSFEGVWGHGFSRRSFLHEKFGSFSLFAGGSCNAGPCM